MPYVQEKIEKLGNNFLRKNPKVEDTWLDYNKKPTVPEKFHTILQELEIENGNKILNVGAGSGFCPLSLSLLAGENGYVDSFEINEKTYDEAKQNISNAYQPKNLNLILGDGFSQPQKNNYDRVFATAAGPQVIPDKKKQTIPKNEINGILKYLTETTKDNAVILLPMGELLHFSEYDCGTYANLYKIRNLEEEIEVSRVDERPSKWSILLGKYGFPKKDMENVRKENNIILECL